MAKPSRIAIFIVVGAVLITGLVWGGLALRSQWRYGATATEADLTLTVHIGDRFTLSVHDLGPSIGDRWSQSAQPAGAVKFVDDEPPANSDGMPGCCSGPHLFLFDAMQSGEVRITLSNCYRGCATEADRKISRDVTWTLTIQP